MEKRLGIIAIVVYDRSHVPEVNRLISSFADIIIARQGVPVPQRSISFISLVVEAEMNTLNTLTGKLGRVEGVEVKSIVTKENSEFKNQRTENNVGTH
ncbi:MAG: iron-only hydrogenase system regulator [Bacteroidales bacterium]|nr:iron-only hydrogenase system regulator [Bacteroidales bacterium]